MAVLKIFDGVTQVEIGGGDVVGPAGATDHTIVRFDGTTGKIIQDSGVIIDDSDNVSTPGNVGIGTNSPAVNLQLGDVGGGHKQITIHADGDALTLKQDVAGDDTYQTWYTAGGVRRGHFGYGQGSSDVLTLCNETGGHIRILGIDEDDVGIEDGKFLILLTDPDTTANKQKGIAFGRAADKIIAGIEPNIPVGGGGHLDFYTAASDDSPSLAMRIDKDGVMSIDDIQELTAAAGVTIDGVLVKDSEVDGRDIATDGAKLDAIEALADVTGSNAPQAHDASHENAGGDEISVAGLSGLLADDQHVLDAEVQAIKLDDFATPDDNTDLDASTTEHGLCPKLNNVATDFLNGQGGWSAPVGGSGDVVGPAGATDHAIVRFDTATGKLVQDSGVLIDDSDNVSGMNSLILDGTSTEALLVRQNADAADVFVVDTTNKSVAINGAASTAAVLDIHGTIPSMGQYRYAGSTAGAGAGLGIGKARGTQASPTVVVNGDNLGNVTFKGYSGAASAFRSAARMRCYVDGVPDSGGDTTDMPGRIELQTSANGSATPTTRFTIYSGGNSRIVGTNHLEFNDASHYIWQDGTDLRISSLGDTFLESSGGRLGPSGAAERFGWDAIGISFFGNTPMAQPDYTTANVTPDRNFDADTVAVAELADIVGTLIADLIDYGLLQ